LKRARAAVAAALLASATEAQVPLPDRTISADIRARFQECRAAVFFHLDGPADRSAALPRAVAQAMAEQFRFVMMETVRNAPGASLAENDRALGFVEAFFIDFSRTVADNRARFADVTERERVLLACQPLLWEAMKERIDYLMLWRERAIDKPEAPAEPAR
jgi:hypothetical protein